MQLKWCHFFHCDRRRRRDAITTICDGHFASDRCLLLCIDGRDLIDSLSPNSAFPNFDLDLFWRLETSGLDWDFGLRLVNNDMLSTRYPIHEIINNHSLTTFSEFTNGFLQKVH